MKTSEPPIVVEQNYPVSPGKLWQALTDPVEMRRWFFPNIPDFKPEKDFKTEFTVENEGRVFPHSWTVTEVVEKKKLVYTWRYDGYRGNSYVVFELKGGNDGTILRLTHHITEDFQKDIPEFTRENCLDGWNYFLGEGLPLYLAEGGS